MLGLALISAQVKLFAGGLGADLAVVVVVVGVVAVGVVADVLAVLDDVLELPHPATSISEHKAAQTLTKPPPVLRMRGDYRMPQALGIAFDDAHRARDRARQRRG
ncbi:MAG: hypothetical protein ACYDHT_13210, partial [Solirubrobacteraceae bacterium]